MVGMASDAFFGLGAVKAPAGTHPLGEVLVAGKATLGLHALPRSVTAHAVLDSGEIRVGACQRTGRHQEVQVLCLGLRRKHCEKAQPVPSGSHQLSPYPRKRATATCTDTMTKVITVKGL